MEHATVVIVGAGPVGLITAMDLAWRGHAAVILEQRTDETPAHPRCNTTSARTMELLRRLGCADEYRTTGLPADFTNDVTWSTGLTGHEFARYYLPPRGASAREDRLAHDGRWHSAERPHRASQFYLERVLRSHAQSFDGIDLRFCQEVVSLDQDDGQVRLGVRDTRTGEEHTLAADWVIGCDGGRSAVRKLSGIALEGEPVRLGQMQAVVFRSPDVLPIMEKHNGAGWMNWVQTEHGSGAIIAIDGEDLWLTHLRLQDDQDTVTPETIEHHITTVVGEPISYEVDHTELWRLNRLVAQHYRNGRVFLAGDAAHTWPPFAGHGMNTGIEDGIALSWLLSGVLDGWAAESILDAYEAERHNIGDKVSHAAAGLALAQFEILMTIEDMDEFVADTDAGEAARRRIGGALIDRDSIQFNAQGMNFGLHYDESPIIVYDDGEAPAYDVRDYTPTTVPGVRAPHFAAVADGTPLYLRLSKGYTLLRSDESIDVSALEAAAAAVGMPFTVLDIEHEPAARDLYAEPLVMVRSDDRVAWRGDAVPDDAAGLIDTLRGAA